MKRILIIEDDPSIAELEKDYLEMNGFAVALCSNGAKGLTMIREGGFDLILLDIMLPGIDGLEILRHIRNEVEVPVLLVSAKKEEFDKIRGLGLGADDYITKPFSPGELIARVQAHLSKYERLRSRFDVAGAAPGLIVRGLEIQKD
ncbi:MAG: response regulator transcription factor, partial [Saccharofermentanales bacterium]